MREDEPEDLQPNGEPRITSLPLSSTGVAGCWAFAVLLLSAGVAGTFYDKSGAPCATLIALGALLLLLALMKRIPLRLEVAGTKIDASYPPDRAFNAGREGGVVEGLETAIDAAERSRATGANLEQLLDLLRQTRERELPLPLRDEQQGVALPQVAYSAPSAPGAVGYRGPTVCRVAGVTYRQLDYWARTGLVEPSIRNGVDPVGPRLYSFEDTIVVALIKRLLDAGVSMQSIRPTIARLREYPTSQWANITLMGDGQSVHEVTSSDQVLAILDSGRGVFGIALAPLMEDARGVLGAPPAEDASS